jgi:hypothetical protein
MLVILDPFPAYSTILVTALVIDDGWLFKARMKRISG